MSRYILIQHHEVPGNVRFDVPPQNAGQAIEVAYGGFSRGTHCHGDPYKRVTDRSVGPHATTYYKLVP